MVKDFSTGIKPFGRAKKAEPSSLSEAVEIQETVAVEPAPAVEPVPVPPASVVESVIQPVEQVPTVSSEEQEKRAKAHRKKNAQYTDATTVRLSPESYKALKYASFDHDVPMWAIVNEALYCTLVEPGAFDWERAKFVADNF